VQVEPPANTKPAIQLPPMNRVSHAPAQTLQLTVPDDQVFVLGDNRLGSMDSRSLGTVPMQDILGRARQVWFSSDAHGVNWSRLGLVLR
jgi:signal peptidase I